MILAAGEIDATIGARAGARLRALLESEPARTVMRVFNGEGVETRIVGGSIRNAVAGAAPSDVDCATTATPQQVMEIAGSAGLKAVGTGVAHGTVTVIVDGQGVELTTLRADVETDGRHARVAFGTDWDEDARRRDFTVNALYLDAGGALHDPVGGLPDVVPRRLRFIGDPARRIAEDYLRILRLFRFAATFGGTPCAQALAAVVDAREGLRRLSAERVSRELLTMLGADDPVAALALMQNYGVLAQILAAAPAVPRVARLIAFERACGDNPDAVLRLGALGVHETGCAERLRRRLRLSNAQAERLSGAFDGWWRVCPERGEGALKEAIYRLGPARYADMMKIAWLHTRQGEPSQAWLDALRLGREWQAPRFALSGKDMIDAGIAAGPQVGARLAELEERWIASGFSLGRDQLLALLGE